MKRFSYLPLALALTVTGAAYAQSPTTSAPTGASQEREPQPANNDLRNPGNPQNQVGPRGTTGTSTTGTTGSSTTGTTGSSTDTTGTTGTTGSSTYNSTDTTSTTPSTSTTDTSTGSSMDTTGTTGSSTSGSMHHARRGHLPKTGSEMPLVGMIGFLALGSLLGLKAFAKRNA
jgi:LPXTG-motif cell wall-anchored protein